MSENAENILEKSPDLPASEEIDVTRRRFLANSLAITGVLLMGQSVLEGEALAQARAQEEKSALQKIIQGQALSKADPDFETVALDIWNKYDVGKRRPQLIVRVADENDVVEAVKFAKANKLKVVVRGGGHNWCNPSLRNDGMMIDLTNLNQVISIDANAHRAVVQPIISNREIQRHLNAQGLSYPSGHCPQVKLSGYLLSGGMSWNQGVWGPGIAGVEAIELVTPDGELITANKDQNTDYYWAARGAGCGFFGIATRYHLKLYDLPKAMAFSSYSYPLSEVGAIAQWLESIAGRLAPNIELSLFMLTAPPELADKCKSDAGKLCMVTATIFADSMEDAASSLRALEECPIIDKCLVKTVAKPCNFETLFDGSGALWPENLHNRVDATFSDSKLADVFNAVGDHFTKSPSPITLIMFAIFTGPDVPAPLPDAAFSMSARYYGGPWTMWARPEDDEANTKWHNKCMKLLQPFVVGQYVGESDTVTYPELVRKAYTENKWKRLEELRKKYDPNGVFFNYFDGLS